MIELSGFERYAIYLSPEPDNALGRFCNGWLGYRPDTGEALSRPLIEGLSPADVERATAAPQRYGFHGTLKAPFRLAPGAAIEDLDRDVVSLAGDLQTVTLDRMRVGTLGAFIAVVPDGGDHAVRDLAKACVMSFDRYRAELTDAERERRLAGGLTARQQELLDACGYPYVLDEFRFHMTLTGPLEESRQRIFSTALTSAMSKTLSGPVTFSDICLFGDPGGGQRFRLLRRYALGRNEQQSPT